MSGNRELSDIDDLAYMIFWSVSLDSRSEVISAEPVRAMDLGAVAKNEDVVFVDHQLSQEYVESAVTEFKSLDWRKFGSGAQEVGAISYVLHSDPKRAICTNSQER